MANDAKMMIGHFDRVESNVEKGENVGYQCFHLFPQCFPKPFFPKLVRSRDCMIKG